MRTAWVLVLVLALAACGDGSATPANAPSADAASIDAPVVVAPLAMTPPMQSFGTVGVGESSLVSPFAITNTTGADTGPLVVALAEASFPTSMDGCSGLPLAAGATCRVYVAFAPQAVGAMAATLTAGDGALAARAMLSGTGTTADNIETVSPMQQGFGSLAVSVRSAPALFMVTNIGATASSVPMVRINGTNRPDFTIASNGCTAAIPAGGTCPIAVTFAPTALAARTANLVVTTASNTVSVGLTGTGTPGAAVVVAPTAFDFGTVAMGTASAPTTITIGNVADTASGTFGVVVGGANATSFVVESTTCPATLAPGASCTATVHFNAGMPGARSATLIAGASTATLTGTSQ